MLTLLVLSAGGIALLLLCGGAVHVWDEQRLDLLFRRAAVRWVPPLPRSRRQRRALRHLPITSPDPEEPRR